MTYVEYNPLSNLPAIIFNKIIANALNTAACLLLGTIIFSPIKISALIYSPDLSKSYKELPNQTLAKHIIKNRLRVSTATQNKFISTLFDLSKQHNFDPFLLLALIEHESKFNLNAIGSVGERGLMQIRPETALWLSQKKKFQYKGTNSLHNPIENLKIGVTYLAYLRTKHQQTAHYLSAYNLGPRKYMQLTRKGVSPKIYYTEVFRIYSLYQPNKKTPT